MAFRRFTGTRPPLLADLPRLRNQLAASRERLAREEAKASARINDLRDLMDEMSGELAEKTIDPAKVARLISEAGDKARAGAPVRLPPRGTVARLIVVSGMKARNEKVPDDE